MIDLHSHTNESDGTCSIGQWQALYNGKQVGVTRAIQRDYFGLWGDFQNDCKKNRLPQYSFVEPPYLDDGAIIAADHHPDHNVQAGDNFIRQVYEAVRSNDDTWHSTLFRHAASANFDWLIDHQMPTGTAIPASARRI